MINMLFASSRGEDGLACSQEKPPSGDRPSQSKPYGSSQVRRNSWVRRAAGPAADRVASSTCRSGPATYLSRVVGSRRATKNPASMTRGFSVRRKRSLLDLRFLEFDVLANDRIVLLEAQLLGLGARVLLRHVIEAGIGGRDELDLDGIGFCHGLVLETPSRADGARRNNSAADACRSDLRANYGFAGQCQGGYCRPAGAATSSGSAGSRCSGSKPCMRCAHCSPTTAPLIAGSSSSGRNRASGTMVSR